LVNKEDNNMNTTNKSEYVGISSRDAFGKQLIALAKENPKIVALTADLASSTRLVEFRQAFPERLFNFGIAEQNMMGAAAGLALAGKIPFVCTFAAFASMRACEQARTDVAYNDLPVRICASHSGLGLAAGGATHHSLEDLSIFRTMPGMTVLIPADSLQAAILVREIIGLKGPSYLRLSRPTEPTVYTEERDFPIGKADVLRTGKDLTIIAIGSMVGFGLKAIETLEKEGLSVGLVNAYSLKPFDRQTIAQTARSTKAVLTVEEHNIIGGLGSAVAEVLAEEGIAVKFKRHGILDHFTTSAPYEDLIHYYKLDAEGIAETARQFIK
jgi:transketolase